MEVDNGAVEESSGKLVVSTGTLDVSLPATVVTWEELEPESVDSDVSGG